MPPDRERIEREADAVILAWYHNDTHDRTHVEPESRSGLVATVAALVRREVEAARADERDVMAHALESRDLICEALQRELGPERTMRALGFDPARIAQSRREIAEGKTVSLGELAAAIRARTEQHATGDGGRA